MEKALVKNYKELLIQIQKQLNLLIITLNKKEQLLKK